MWHCNTPDAFSPAVRYVVCVPLQPEFTAAMQTPPSPLFHSTLSVPVGADVSAAVPLSNANEAVAAVVGQLPCCRVQAGAQGALTYAETFTVSGGVG